MIDLTPLDVRKKKGDFRRAVRGYDAELVDDFLDMVAERLEELVKQNVALTERTEHLQDQVGSFREREKALNEALVSAQQLRSEAQAQADREADLVRREAQGQAERIVEEQVQEAEPAQIEGLQARKNHFVRAFRTLLERYLSELEMDEARVNDAVSSVLASARAVKPVEADSEPVEVDDEPVEKVEPVDSKQADWLSSLVTEADQEEVN